MNDISESHESVFGAKPKTQRLIRLTADGAPIGRLGDYTVWVQKVKQQKRTPSTNVGRPEKIYFNWMRNIDCQKMQQADASWPPNCGLPNTLHRLKILIILCMQKHVNPQKLSAVMQKHVENT